MSNESKFVKASEERPWMKYYPEMLRNVQVPQCTLLEYLKMNCPGEDVAAMSFYGTEITWAEVFTKTEAVARSLKAVGFKEGDQFPIFTAYVPEFLYTLLAAEKIGISVLCRDNTLEENVESVEMSGSKVIMAHDFLSQDELKAYLAGSYAEKVILLDACQGCNREDLPEHNKQSLDAKYSEESAHGPKTMTWDEFIALGEAYEGEVEAATDINRPLVRVYTSGSTGPSKQVIHSANTMISVVAQMNFYSGAEGFRPTWLLSIFPPALVTTIIAFTLLPLASNKLLYLSPYAEIEDTDLELMQYRPNGWGFIPLLMEIIIRSKRIPKDYDMSHLVAAGAGAEALNNTQLARAQQFLLDHNCNIRFTTGYGCSEAGSSVTLPMTPHPMGNGNVGVPMILNVMSIFKPGTQEELPYNTSGEICVSGPGVMLGYDKPEDTAKALQVHEDGLLWLHTGDIGIMNEDGVIYTQTRGSSPRRSGGDLAVLPMENRLADANIEGIEDQFFVVVPDQENPGYFLPYVYVVLKDGYKVPDIADKIRASLDSYMEPIEIFELPERPFFHFKTNRIGLTQEILKYQKAVAKTLVNENKILGE